MYRVNGFEIFKMMQEGKFKDGDEIKDFLNDIVFRFGQENFWDYDGEDILNSYFLSEFLNKEFDIMTIEETEIDIQAIYDFDEVRDLSTWSNETLSDNQRTLIKRVSQLIKAIKQLDKKIK